jgi:hypothetical protein
MRKRMFWAFMALSLVASAALPARAVVPELIPVQGVLADDEGAPLDGSFDIVFALYGAETAGTALWTESRTGEDAVAVDDGLFTVYLGDLTPLDFASLLDDPELWLEMQVGADEPMNRVRLASVPYAEEAEFCAQVGDLLPEDLQTVLDFACGDDQFLRGWDAVSNLPECAAFPVSPGDITAVQTPVGSGLTGGATEGEVSLSVSDVTSAMIADGTITFTDWAQSGCATDQIPKWNGIAWACAADADTDTNTTYSAGTGLSLAGTTFSLNTTYTDSQYVNEAQANSVTSAMIANGAIAFADWAQNGCTANQIPKWNGTAWACAADADTDTVGWALTGNAGTVAGTSYLGTSDDVALDIRVNNTRAFRLEPNATSPNVVGGWSGNWVDSGYVGATIAGGGGTGGPNIVASQWGTVGGGFGNTVGGQYSNVGGGYGNEALGSHCAVLGGENNTANTMNPVDVGSVVCGGSDNTAANAGGVVVGGASNEAYNFGAVLGGEENSAGGWGAVGSGMSNSAGNNSFVGSGVSNQAWQSATVVGGTHNTASGDYSAVGGGGYNTASADYATIPGGYGATADHTGQLAQASGYFSAAGDAQTSRYVLRTATTNASPTAMFLDGSSSRLTITDGRTVTFDALVVGRSNTGQSAGYRIQGVIENVGGTTAFIGTPTVTVLGEDNPAWNVSVLADDTNDALSISVTGVIVTNVRWVATVETAEVSW